MPALVIATYRDDELERDHPLRVVLGELGGAHRMTVEPLSPGAVARLAAAHGVDGAGLYARTGGNPFFVTEVLARRGASTPGSVRDAVLARAARLSAPARRLLEAVAVARPRAEICAAGADRAGGAPGARGVPGVGDAARRGRRGRASATRSRARRSRTSFRPTGTSPCIGRRWPPWSGAPSPARLAHHAEAAGDGAAVLEHSQAAGERAARLGAHREAAAHFAAALRHAGGLEPATRAALLERRAQECFLSGMIQEAVDAETLALEIYVDDRGTGCGRATPTGRSRRSPGTRATASASRTRPTTAIEILETLPPGRELALAYGRRATNSMMEFDLAGVREWGQRAIDLAERLGETEVLVAATCNVGTVELAHGLAEGREKLLRSLELALDARLEDHAAVIYCNLVAGSHDIRDYETAVAQLEAGRAFCDEHDLLAWYVYLGGWEAHIALDHGRWAEAAALAAREPRAHARLAAAQPVPLADRPGSAARPPRRRGPVAGARRGAGHRRRGERARHARSRRRRAGGGALARRRGGLGRGGDRRRAGARRAQRPSLDDRRARDVAPPRGPAARRQRAAAAALPGGARRRRPSGRGVLARSRVPLRRGARARLQ